MQPAIWHWILGYVILALILWAITFGAIHSRRKQRLIQNIPTSKTAGVFIGLVEVKGSAESSEPITSELAEKKCVHFSFSVQEHWSKTVTESYTDSQGKRRTRRRTKSGWKTIESGGNQIPFYLKDDSGILLIRPFGAKLEPVTVYSETVRRSDPLYYSRGHHSAVSDSTHKRRFVEQAIPLHQPLYIIGKSRERQDVAAAEIAKDELEKMFLISTRSEDKIQKSLGSSFWIYMIFGLLVSGFAPWLIQNVVIHNDSYPILAGGLSILIYVLQFFVRWGLMVFNDLVDLKNRVQQAASNIDVQLKRRHDLIPRLIEIVQGLKDYEIKTQKYLATLRTQSTTETIDGPNEAHACKDSIIAIAEAYPEMKSNDSFLKLQKGIIDTEERIALARNYFNDIVTQYNTRRETIPDQYFASIAGLKHIRLFEAQDFKRAQIQIDFVE